jgi:hypothetical protein
MIIPRQKTTPTPVYSLIERLITGETRIISANYLLRLTHGNPNAEISPVSGWQNHYITLQRIDTFCQ